MGEMTHQNPKKRGQAGRFVLLVDAHTHGPMKLLEGLRKRDAAVRVVNDAAQAMVEVAQFKAQVIIVHEPESVRGLEAMLSAIRLYHPAVICWRHEAARSGKRENLSPFACQLKPAAPPRFTPAPASLRQSIGTAASGNGHEKGKNNSRRNGQPATDAPRSQSIADKPQTTQKHDSNQPHATSHGQSLAKGISPDGDAYVDPQGNGSAMGRSLGGQSLGQRLAMPLDALDDLTAGPLLSAEEIELLRGPAQGDPGDDGFDRGLRRS